MAALNFSSDSVDHKQQINGFSYPCLDVTYDGT